MRVRRSSHELLLPASGGVGLCATIRLCLFDFEPSTAFKELALSLLLQLRMSLGSLEFMQLIPLPLCHVGHAFTPCVIPR